MGLLRFQRALKSSLLVLSLATFSAHAEPPPGDEDISLEYQVKAAFVFNFARFVTWPAATFASPETPMLIGLLGQDALTSALQKTLDGKTVEGRQLVVKPWDSAAAPVQILIVAQSEGKRAAAALKTLDGKPTLTVGESKSFLSQGGMIRLDLNEDKVRFTINQPAVDQSGLVISSQMLQYAGKEE